MAKKVKFDVVQLKQDFPTLAKAPIKVAILEIRFEAPSDVTHEKLAAVEKVLVDYPEHKVQKVAEVKLGVDIPNPTLTTKDTGHFFMSENRSNDILLTPSIFNFRQHGHYTNWSDFKAKALASWNLCKPHLRPSKYTRFSLRYINHIDFKDLDTIFEGGLLFNTFIVREGGVVDKPIAGFTLRYTHMYDEEGVQVNFMEEQLPGSVPNVIPFVIDIDVLHVKDYLENEIDIEKKFDRLRLFKNTYFFDNLTKYSLKTLS